MRNLDRKGGKAVPHVVNEVEGQLLRADVERWTVNHWVGDRLARHPEAEEKTHSQQAPPPTDQPPSDQAGDEVTRQEELQ